jgi:hypothetical protein
MDFRNHFYFTLFGNASQKTYPEITLFTVQLAKLIDLGSTDRWEVVLCEFSCSPFYVGFMTNALIYCDLIMPQLWGSVRQMFSDVYSRADHTFKNIYYMPVEKRAFQNISIVIADLYGDKIIFKSSDVPKERFFISDVYKYVTS